MLFHTTLRASLTLILLLTFYVSCGEKVKLTMVPPTQSPSLLEESARIDTATLWEEGMPVPELGGDMGDTHIRGCTYALLTNDYRKQGIFDFVARSIKTDGQPLRSPYWKWTNSYSRDQLLGLVMCTLAGLPKIYLDSVYGYIERTGKICPDADDTRCNPTPGTHVMVKDTLGEEVDVVSRAIADNQTFLETLVVTPGYQSTLVALTVLIKIKQDKVSSLHQDAMRSLVKNVPENLFFWYVHNLVFGLPQEDLKAKLLECMTSVAGGGPNWHFEAGHEFCKKPAYGSEFIALAKALLLF